MNDFNPIIFLELKNLSPREQAKLKPQLLEKITQFILLKTAQEKKDQFSQASSLEEILSIIDQHKLAAYLQEFKDKFQKEYRG